MEQHEIVCLLMSGLIMYFTGKAIFRIIDYITNRRDRYNVAPDLMDTVPTDKEIKDAVDVFNDIQNKLQAGELEIIDKNKEE